MADHNKGKTFCYTAKETGQSFPLDLTVAEWSRAHGFHRNTASKYLTCNNVFSDLYSKMRFYIGASDTKSPHSRLKGIPVELEEFLADYINAAIRYSQNHKRTAEQIGSDAGFPEFDRIFCEEYLKKAQEPEAKQSFLIRRLYANETFENMALEEFWNLLRDRFRMFEELTKKLKPEVQMVYLKYVLEGLNLQIGNIASMEPENKEETSKFKMPFLETFPQEVISYFRSPVPAPRYASKGDLITYDLPNLKVTADGQVDSCMKDAFEEIQTSATGQSQLQKPAREAYVNYLKTKLEKTEFEKQCDHMRGYLSGQEEYVEDARLSADIHEICIALFQPIVQGMPIPWELKMEERNHSEYYRTLFDAAFNQCCRFIQYYQYPLSLFTRLAETEQESDVCRAVLQMNNETNQWKNIEKHGSMSKDDYVKQEKQRFLAEIEGMWSDRQLGKKEDFNRSVLDGHIKPQSQKLVTCYTKLLKNLDLENPYWATEENIMEAMAQYRKVLEGDYIQEPGYLGTPCFIYLRKLIMASRIYEEFDRVEQSTFRYYKYLLSEIQKPGKV